MIDAENLSKLLGHLPPEVFSAFMTKKFGLEMPELDKKATKKDQRAGMAAVLETLAVSVRKEIEEIAEEIMLLSDGPGQDVLDGCEQNILDDEARAQFAKTRGQYERSLWLFLNEHDLFKEALNGREADVFRQSPSCYSGFTAPKNLKVLEDSTVHQAFHKAVADELGCVMPDVSVQIFKRLRPDTDSGEDVALYQVSIDHNRPPQVVDRVLDSEVVPQEIVSSISSHITYEPENGHLEVLSKFNAGREELARIFSDHLLLSPITGEKIPLKQYDYQSLSAPRTFDLSNEPTVSRAMVTELGYCTANYQSILVKIGARSIDDIHAAARSLISPTFSFEGRRLNYAKLSIRLKKLGKGRARTISVIMRDENKCNIKTKREKDRVLCDRLLAKWGLIKEVGGGNNAEHSHTA